MTRQGRSDQSQIVGDVPLTKPSHRMEQVNANIKRMFGEILQVEADLSEDVIVTVTEVETTPNLRSAQVWLSIWPTDKGEEVIRRLKPQMYELQGALNRGLNMRPLPRVKLIIDHGAEHAEKIQRKLDELS